MGTRLGLSGPMMDPSIYSFYEMMNDDVNPGTLSLPLSLPMGGPSLGPLWAHEEAQACAHHVPWEAHTRDHHGPVGAPGLGRSCGCVVVGVVVGVVSLLLWLVLLFFPIQVLSNDRSYRKKCATPIIQKQTAIHTDTHTHTHIHCASEAWAVQQVGTPLPSSVSQSLSGVRPHNHSITMSLYLLLCGAQARAIMGHERPKPVPIMGPWGAQAWAHHGP
jgi:hypothetical protein